MHLLDNLMTEEAYCEHNPFPTGRGTQLDNDGNTARAEKMLHYQPLPQYSGSTPQEVADRCTTDQE